MMTTAAAGPRDGTRTGSRSGGEVDIARQRLARPAALMAVGTALSRVTGLGRVIAMTFALGVTTSRLADSYNLANTLPNVVYELVLGGVLTSVFIPVVVQELRSGGEREEVWRTVSGLVTAALGLLLAMSIATIFLAPWIVEFFTLRVGGVAGDAERGLATFFLRVFALQIFLYGFAAVAAGLLNSHGKFGLPMFTPIVNNLVVIGMFFAFAAIVGGVPTAATVAGSPMQKWLLALGTTGGVAAMALAYLPSIRRLPGRLRPRLDLGHPAVRKLGRMSAWTVFYVFVNTVGFVVSFYLAGSVQGGVTAYVTAFAFFQLPVGIAAVSVMTALVPKLSAFHVGGDGSAFRDGLRRGIRATVLLMLPATAALIVLAHPMVETLLEHGLVRASGAALVSSVLVYFAVGLAPFAGYLLLLRAFYTRQDARTPALVNLAGNAVTVGLDFALFPVLEVRGLALAHSVGYVAGSAVAWIVLSRVVGGLADRALGVEFAKALVAALACAGAMAGGVAVGWAAVGPGGARALLELLLGGAFGLVAFLAAARLLRCRDLEIFTGKLLPARFRRAPR